MEVLQIIKIELPCDPENPTSGYITKGNEISILAFIFLFIKHYSQRPRYGNNLLLINEQRSKLWYAYTMGYSALRNKNVLLFWATC
jgi:hypothetical protein